MPAPRALLLALLLACATRSLAPLACLIPPSEPGGASLYAAPPAALLAASLSRAAAPGTARSPLPPSLLSACASDRLARDVLSGARCDNACAGALSSASARSPLAALAAAEAAAQAAGGRLDETSLHYLNTAAALVTTPGARPLAPPASVLGACAALLLGRGGGLETAISLVNAGLAHNEHDPHLMAAAALIGAASGNAGHTRAAVQRLLAGAAVDAPPASRAAFVLHPQLRAVMHYFAASDAITLLQDDVAESNVTALANALGGAGSSSPPSWASPSSTSWWAPTARQWLIRAHADAASMYMEELMRPAAAVPHNAALVALLPGDCGPATNLAWALLGVGSVEALARAQGALQPHLEAVLRGAHSSCSSPHMVAFNAAQVALETGRDVAAWQEAAALLKAAAALAPPPPPQSTSNNGNNNSDRDEWLALVAATTFPLVLPDDEMELAAMRAASWDALVQLSHYARARYGGWTGAPPPPSSTSAFDWGACLRLRGAADVKAWSGLPEAPFFYHYHGHNDDRKFQEAYHSLLRCNFEGVQRVIDAAVGDRPGSGGAATQRAPRSGRRLRVGFASRYFSLQHPHAQLLTPIVRGLDRSRFEPHVLHLGAVAVVSDDQAADRAAAAVGREPSLVATLEASRAAGPGCLVIGEGGLPKDVTLHEAAAGAPFSETMAMRGSVNCSAVIHAIPSSSLTAAASAIAALGLDVLVYADHMSEGLSYSLGFLRLARVQALFWGNPVTSGHAGSMDFFVSAASLEGPTDPAGAPLLRVHPRVPLPDPAAAEAPSSSLWFTDAALKQQPPALYSEALVELGGVNNPGFLYDAPAPPPPSQLCRCRAWGLPNPPGCDAAAVSPPDSLDALRFLHSPSNNSASPPRPFVFGCLQSLYKLHPRFDAVLVRVLARTDPRTRLVLMEERKPLHTRQYKDRLAAAAAAAGLSREALDARVTWLPRQPGSAAFLAAASCVDALLHPFPFDGSRTAADSIALGVPLVTLPSARHARGRMGGALYDAAGLGDLVVRCGNGKEGCSSDATAIAAYVDTAVALAEGHNGLWDAWVARVRKARDAAFLPPHWGGGRTAQGQQAPPTLVAAWEAFLEAV